MSFKRKLEYRYYRVTYPFRVFVRSITNGVRKFIINTKSWNLHRKINKQNAWYDREAARKRLEPLLVHFPWKNYRWDYERDLTINRHKLDFINVITLPYRFYKAHGNYKNARFIYTFLPYTDDPVDYYEECLEYDIDYEQPEFDRRPLPNTVWTRKIQKAYYDPIMVEFIIHLYTWREYKKAIIDDLKDLKAVCRNLIKRIRWNFMVATTALKFKRIFMARVWRSPNYIFRNFKSFFKKTKRPKRPVPRHKRLLRYHWFRRPAPLNVFTKRWWTWVAKKWNTFRASTFWSILGRDGLKNYGKKKKSKEFFSYADYRAFQQNSSSHRTHSFRNDDVSYIMPGILSSVYRLVFYRRPYRRYRRCLYTSVYTRVSLKGSVVFFFNVFFNNLGRVSVHRPFLSFFLFSKKTIVPILIAFLCILFSFVSFKLSFFRVGGNWLAVFLFVFWLLSGFNFFVKHARFGKHTTANQRFWKRTLMIFWLIEGFLFVLFFYYALNASAEPLFMYDQVGMFNRQLQDIRTFVFNIFLIVLVINILVYLLIYIKYSTFRQHSVFFFVVTLLLVYVLLVESYQFYYLTNYYDDSSWVYSEDEQVWELDYEIPRARNRSHYMTLIVLAKFWHYIFIFGCWTFFVMKALELSRTRYAILAMNLQNLLIFYVMAWVCMYAWLKWFTRRFLDQQYYWFFTSFRPTILNAQLLGMVDLFGGVLPTLATDLLRVLGLSTALDINPHPAQYSLNLLHASNFFAGYGSTVNAIAHHLLVY